MSGRLDCEIQPRLDAVSAAEWERLFPGLPDSMEMVRLVQRAGLDGFAFHSIVVRCEGQPILMLPLFETRYHLSTLVDRAARPSVNAFTAWLPGLLQPHILGVGFVEGEWSQVGVEPEAGPAVLDAAWDLALTALTALADGLGADLTAFVHFTEQSGRWLPMHKLAGYAGMEGLPCARLPIAYDDLDAYLRTLSAKMRADLRRKLRKAGEVDIVQTRDPGPWLDTIYQHYLETVANNDLVFGVHRRAYFEQVCRTVPGAEYWLYFAADRLLAFKLVVVTPDCLVDKYFGMDHALGRDHNLYFVAWAELIRYCIERKIPLYHASQAEEATKSRLGARLIPSRILFKHRHPLAHQLLALLSRHLAYEPQVPLPKAELGTGWREAAPGSVRTPEAWVPARAAESPG